MTTLTMRLVRGDFIVTGPDIEPMTFQSRREARDWGLKLPKGTCRLPPSPQKVMDDTPKAQASAASHRLNAEPHDWFWHQRVLPGEGPGPTPVPGELTLFWPVLPGG